MLYTNWENVYNWYYKLIPKKETFVLLYNGKCYGLISYIDSTAKCHHLKNLTCKGTLRQVSIRVFRLEIQSVMLVGIFDPALWTVAPLTFSLVRLSPSRVSPFIWSDSEPTKLLDHPKQNSRRGGGLRQTDTCREVPLQVIFLYDNYYFLLWCLHSQLVHGKYVKA